MQGQVASRMHEGHVLRGDARGANSTAQAAMGTRSMGAALQAGPAGAPSLVSSSGGSQGCS